MRFNECVKLGRPQHFVWDANIGNDDVAAQCAAWHQKVSGLFSEEGHGAGCVHDRTFSGAGRSVKAAWYIDGENF